MQCGSLEVRAELNHQFRVDHLSLLRSWRLWGGGNLDISEKRAAGNICVSRACHISRGGTRPDVTRVPQKKSRNAWQQRCWPGYRFKTLLILQIQCNHITRCELVAKKTRKNRYKEKVISSETIISETRKVFPSVKVGVELTRTQWKVWPVHWGRPRLGARDAYSSKNGRDGWMSEDLAEIRKSGGHKLTPPFPPSLLSNILTG